MSRGSIASITERGNLFKSACLSGRLRVLLAVLAAMLAPAVSVAQEPPASAADRRNAVLVFGAQMSSNKWTEIAAFDDVSMRDAYLAGIGLSREIWGGEDWAIEAEGQVAKHFGREDHWEFNAALIGRWRDFPWNEWVPTGLAFGAGPSYATEVPPEEVANDGDSARFLLYWVAELELGLPGNPWSAVARLHHRSTGYGVFAERGGSNWLTLGIRRRF